MSVYYLLFYQSVLCFWPCCGRPPKLFPAYFQADCLPQTPTVLECHQHPGVVRIKLRFAKNLALKPSRGQIWIHSLQYFSQNTGIFETYSTSILFYLNKKKRRYLMSHNNLIFYVISKILHLSIEMEYAFFTELTWNIYFQTYAAFIILFKPDIFLNLFEPKQIRQQMLSLAHQRLCLN